MNDAELRGLAATLRAARGDGHAVSVPGDTVLEILDRVPLVECEWSPSDEDAGTWSSGCGELYVLIDGAPTDNHMRWCHFCGCRLRERQR